MRWRNTNNYSNISRHGPRTDSDELKWATDLEKNVMTLIEGFYRSKLGRITLTCSIVVVLALVQVGCAPLPQLRSGPVDPVTTVLDAVPLDSLCANRCSTVLIDTVLRESYRLVPYRPGSNQAIRGFSSDWSGMLSSRVSHVAVVGAWLETMPSRDTAEVAVYEVIARTDTSNRLYGVAFLPPNGDTIIWAVELKETIGGWIVVKNYLFYEV
jgi:hypothetical protein